MIPTKYGSYSSTQLSTTKEFIRKQIFYLLLYVDPNTCNEYSNGNVTQAFKGLQYKLAGLNSILLESPHLVSVMSLLEAALLEYQTDDFNFQAYRKLILDAGNEILKIDDNQVCFKKVLAKCNEVDKTLINSQKEV